MSRPNLLLFMPDQLRADAVGAFGSGAAHTPNIDALAAAGTRFSNAYSQHSVCSQSRISMFTGWYPHVNGHRTLTHLLQPHEPNVFRDLRNSGYHVALAGTRGDMLGEGVTKASSDRYGYTRVPDLGHVQKWHHSPFEPDSKWFNAFYAGPLDDDLFEFDAATVGTAVDWLTEGLPEPWCLFIPLIYPHPPFIVERRYHDLHDPADMPLPVPPDFTGKPDFYRAIHERYQLDRLDGDDWAEIIRTYYGMVSRVDDQLGQVRRAVDQAGATDHTVTMFFTDHGEFLGDFGLIEKWMSGLDDVLVRNPLIIDDPTTSAGPVESFAEMVDITATLHDYAEIEPTYTHFGRSLRPAIADPTVAHRDAAFSEGGFVRSEEPLLELGTGGQYKHKQDLQHEQPELTGRAISVRTEKWAYIERLYEAPELYDRVADPRETTNVIDVGGNESVAADHKERIFRWLFETSDVIPWTEDPRMDADLRATWLP